MSILKSFDAIYNAFNRQFNEFCQNEGYNEITVNNYQYIAAIFSLKKATVTELAKKLNIRKASVTQMIDSLVKKGYVVRESPSGDKRSYEIKLTDKGTEMMELEEKFINKFIGRFDKILSTQEFKEFSFLLEKISENIEGENHND